MFSTQWRCDIRRQRRRRYHSNSDEGNRCGGGAVLETKKSFHKLIVMYKYVIALTLITAIVFVEEMSILYNPLAILTLLLITLLTTIYYIKDNIGNGLLLIALTLLVYIRSLRLGNLVR
jgi:hypothetical protein